jgi:hypothetical protein
MIIQEASEIYPEKTNHRADWFSTGATILLQLITTRNRAEYNLSLERTELNLKHCQEARRNLKREIRKAKEDWLNEQIKQLEGMNGNPFSAWQAVNAILDGLTGHHKKGIEPAKILKTDGSLTETDEEAVKTLSEYFKVNVFGRQAPYDDKAIEEMRQRPVAEWLAEPFTLKEFQDALRKAKTRKAPGPNGIRIEQFKKLDEKSQLVVLQTLNEFCTNPNFDSDDWHKVNLKLLPKKGNTKLPKNWRPISLIDVLQKILSAMHGTRLNAYLVQIGLPEQAGFMSERGCPDATAAMKITLQNLSASGQEAYVLFVDIVKAFDSVNREMLWKLLVKFGLPAKMIATIKKMYTDVTITTKIGKVTEEFKSTSGVKQGDNLAPILFLFVIQAAVETMEKNWPVDTPDLEWSPDEFIPGINSNDGQQGRVHHKGSLTHRSLKSKEKVKLKHSRSFYADDGAFFFLSYEDLVTGTKFVYEQFQRFGLEMHLGKRATEPGGQDENSKTEAMYFPPSDQRKNKAPAKMDTYDVGTDGQRYVNFCSSFKYLGTYITPDLDDTFDIEARITAATKAWGAMKSVLMNKFINRDIRTNLYMAIVVNVLLWGCDSWALKETDMKKLKSFHTKKARSLCGINMSQVEKHHISNEDVLKRLKMMPADKLIAIRQLRLLQKIARQSQSRLPRKILNSQAVPRPGIQCNNRHATTRKTYRDFLVRAKLIEKSSAGNLDEWIPKLKMPGIGKSIEENLGLPKGSFQPGRKPRRSETRPNKTLLTIA